MLRVTLFYLLMFSISPVFGFLEESEGVIPKDRTCDPEEERAAQSCKNGLTVLSATFESIQGQHESFTASDHIGINQNCKTALTCLKTYIGCSDITQADVDTITEKCNYMTYLTGGFYACSQKLKERKDTSPCVMNFFDADKDSQEKPGCEWINHRACLKWTIRDACGRSYWKQYKPYWHLKSSFMKCE
ncbi:hypothetical protein GCK72_020318 [Caenorhabditis remanei]|uniref:T20D4.11-like domain-containing protein n=1 Tax=Caenorhabditis remanei TaxID=31234 RepID=A0A6A5GGP1_CAERE|nr:hypothetical protein GCK72_020318 [Caenorhabditis remanei]KAF1753761.1 hypothetical protein GCK72_020318 [Caenorhabditis remanei]